MYKLAILSFLIVTSQSQLLIPGPIMPMQAAAGGSITWEHETGANSASASNTTASITVPAGTVTFLTLGISMNGGTAPGADDNVVITGGGTWTQIAEYIFGSRRVLYVFHNNATAISGTLAIAWDNGGSDGTWEQGTYSIDSATCHTTVPVSNVTTNSGTGTSGTVTIPGTIHSGDHTAFFVAHATSEAVTLEGSQTSLHAATGLTGLRTFNFSYDGTPTIDQTPSATWATSDSWGCVGFIVETP